MRIIVRATEEQKKEWLQKPASGAEIIFTTGALQEGEIFFDLMFDETNPHFIETEKPVFINAVISTLAVLPENCIRINAWGGFLQRGIAEIAARDFQKQIAETVMHALSWKYQLVPDVAGMITPRIISMIINEAYFALQEEVSTKEEIDLAMKLGTNYPYGPFEWSKSIGLKNIYQLLKKLSETDNRYTVAELLKKEANH